MVQYHEAKIAICQNMSRSGWENAARLSQNASEKFLAAIRLFRSVLAYPEKQSSIPSKWETGVLELEESFVCLRLAANSIAEAIAQARISLHHNRMRIYYANLRDSQAAEIPPLPEAIKAERLAVEKELQRVRGLPSLKLLPEPPTHLLPGALKPRSQYDPGARAGSPGGPPESW